MRAILDDAVAFYADLEADNSRAFWARERHRYDAAVRPVFTALLDGVASFGAWRIYRPHNDTRFRNAAPYKTFAGAVAERPNGVGAFVQVSARGLLVGTGIPMPASDQLPKLRQSIADARSGAAFERAVHDTTSAGAKVFGGRYDPLVRVPRGFPKDHPRADFLRWKGVETNQRIPHPGWRTTDEGADEIERLLALPEPIHVWLARHVGPSSLTPEERFAPKRRS